MTLPPGARRSRCTYSPTRVKATSGGLCGGALKVRIAAPAVDNKANAQLIGFLSETLGVPKAAIAIRHGIAGRRKVVGIAGGAELVTRLETLTVDRITIHESRVTPST
jgi:uncharacterized protein (TIGR00251 family)